LDRDCAKRLSGM